MESTVQSEAVGAKIVEWYSCVISKSYDQAVLLKEESKRLVSGMAENDKMLAYYSLVEYRHNILAKSYDKNELNADFSHIEEIAEVDNMLKYLYYFVSGQNEYVHERYRSAVKLFEKAGRLLEYVNDDAEEAEFYLYTGVAYYRLNQYLIASSYMEQASVIFDRLGYTEPSLNCQIILAGIYQELHNPEKGERILKDSLVKAHDLPLPKALILRVLGLNKVGVKDYIEAESYFRKALSYDEHRNIAVGAKTAYNLCNALFNQGKMDDASHYFQVAQAGATYYKNKEYIARCTATEGLYIKHDYNLVDKAIDQLESLGMDFETAEVAEEASEFAEKMGNTELALKYMKTAHKARLYQNALGDDQE